MIELFYYRENKNQPVHELPLLSPPFHELTICLGGEMAYREKNGEKYVIKTGDVLFLSPKTERYRFPIKDAHYISFNFRSDEEFSMPQIVRNALSPAVQQMIITCRAIMPTYHNINDERYTSLLRCIIRQIEHDIVKKEQSPLVSIIKQYVKDNLAQKITLKDIEKVTFFSGIYCDYVFKKETGKPIIDYVIEKRIQQAQLLMVEENYTLVEIARQVGYNDYNYFSRTFKLRTGYTPLQYKSVMKYKLYK